MWLYLTVQCLFISCPSMTRQDCQIMGDSAKPCLTFLQCCRLGKDCGSGYGEDMHIKTLSPGEEKYCLGSMKG